MRCMRSDPESWSGVSMHASITSARRLAQRSRSRSGATPFAPWRVSASAHLVANVARLIVWWRLIPDDSSVPEVAPSKWTIVAAGW